MEPEVSRPFWQQPVTCPCPQPDGSCLHLFIFVTSDFRREADGNCTLLGYYGVSSSNLLPTFRDNLSVSSSGIKNPKLVLDSCPLQMETIGRPETSVRDNHYLLRNNPEERSSLLTLLLEYPCNVILSTKYFITRQTHTFSSCYSLLFLVMLRRYVTEQIRTGSSAMWCCVTLLHSGV